MKTLFAVLIALVQTSCILTKLEPVDLCISSPQEVSNELECQNKIQNNK